MPSLRVGNCIFCDDLRTETGNKHSLMGIYNGELIFSAPPPVLLPRLVVVAWLNIDIDDVPENVIFTLRLPMSDTDVLRQPVELPRERPQGIAGIRRVALQWTGIVGPLVVDRGGLIEVFAEVDDDRIRLGLAVIRFPEDPQKAPLPPPEGDTPRPHRKRRPKPTNKASRSL
jgi:hypothetical protein